MELDFQGFPRLIEFRSDVRITEVIHDRERIRVHLGRGLLIRRRH